MFIVYHLHSLDDKGDYTKGYINYAVDVKDEVNKLKQNPPTRILKEVFETYRNLTVTGLKRCDNELEALVVMDKIRPQNTAWNQLDTMSDESKESIAKANAKSFWIYYPNGDRRKIKNLSKFCRDNRLDRIKIMTQKGHKGYKCKRADSIKRNTYIVTTPDGIDVETMFLPSYCKDNNLTYQKMHELAHGKGLTHKGYKCRIKGEKVKENYRYLITSPTDEIYKVDNLRQFCSEYGLKEDSMRKVLSGFTKQGHYKNWTIKKI